MPFIINQNRYSIFDRTIENNGLKAMAARLHKGIITFSPLAQGLLTDICRGFRLTAGYAQTGDF